MKLTPDEVPHELPLMYNWTEVERYDSTDLRLWLRGLRPYAQYEILVQAFNQFGRGPMARAKAFTLSEGKKILFLLSSPEIDSSLK